MYKTSTAFRQALEEKIKKDAVQENVGQDFCSYLIGDSTLRLEAPPHGGYRYPVEALIDFKLYVKFQVDVVLSSLSPKFIESLETKNELNLPHIKIKPFLVISNEEQFAEKLHAYTLPRNTGNSRVKDLVDMYSLIATSQINYQKTSSFIVRTFKDRGTHKLEEVGLREPPLDWGKKFEKQTEQLHLTIDMLTAIRTVAHFTKLPLYTYEDYPISIGNKSPCYICKNESLMVEKPMEYLDVDCQKCSRYRATISSIEYFKNDTIPRRSWAVYLQNRSEEKKKYRVIISTINAYPPKQ